MDTERVVRHLFILYCATVGSVLVVVPWSPGWNQMLSHLSASFELLGTPLLRGALSGFGLVHMVWCVHDVHRMTHHDSSRHGS